MTRHSGFLWATAAFLCSLSVLGLRAHQAPNHDNPSAQAGQAASEPHRLSYGSFGYVADPFYDRVPPELPTNLKSGGILVYSKTNGWRDEPALEASTAVLVAIAVEHHWLVFATENAAVMNKEQLRHFKVVFWNNNSGDTLTPDQRAAFKEWLESGGTYIGIHGSGGDPVVNQGHTSLADWPWYIQSVVGAQFRMHSTIQVADIHVDTSSPIMHNLPAVWPRADEFYGFTNNPEQEPGFHILAKVDESTYSAPPPARMGPDHPLAWWHCVGKGHALYSAMAHGGSMYAEPLTIQFLDNAMSWGVSVSGHPCGAKR